MIKSIRYIPFLICFILISVFIHSFYLHTYANPPQILSEVKSKPIESKILAPSFGKQEQPQSVKPCPYIKKGIDVSHHNGDIDWRAVKDSGIEFAIIRTGYGWEAWDKQTDRKLKANIDGAKSVGMPIGAYHYSYATTPQEALKEAEFFIDRLKWAQWEYPVFFDFEDKCQAKLNNSQKTDVILTFLQKLQEAGYYTGYYTFLNWQRYCLDMNRLGGHQLWIAHWNPNCGCHWPYGIWQYTSNGHVPGINGRVDLNYCYVDYPSIIKNLHLNGF